MGPYSEHLIFFLAYEWAKYARVFHHAKLERLASAKHSSLLGSLVSYEEGEVLLMLHLLPMLKNFLRRYVTPFHTKLERFSLESLSSLV